MSSILDQIEIKFKDGSPLWVYIQELVPLALPDGSVASYMPNRIPIEPSDPRVQEYIGTTTSAAIAEAQRQTQIAADAIAGRDAAQAGIEAKDKALAEAYAERDELRAKLGAHDDLQLRLDTTAAELANLRAKLAALNIAE